MIPDWKLERYLLGELPAAEMERVKAAVESDLAVNDKLEALRRSNQELLTSHPPAWMARKVALRAGGAESVLPTTRASFPLVPSMVSLAALLVVVPILWFAKQDADQEQGDERLKGMVNRLELFRQAKDTIEQLPEGALAAAGDLVQLRWQVARESFGAIVSVDGRGQITLHMPESNNAGAVRLAPGRSNSLPHSYELDDAPLTERFFLVTAADSFAVADMMRRLKTGTAKGGVPLLLPLPPQWSQTTFTLRKKEGT